MIFSIVTNIFIKISIIIILITIIARNVHLSFINVFLKILFFCIARILAGVGLFRAVSFLSSVFLICVIVVFVIIICSLNGGIVIATVLNLQSEGIFKRVLFVRKIIIIFIGASPLDLLLFIYFSLNHLQMKTHFPEFLVDFVFVDYEDIFSFVGVQNFFNEVSRSLEILVFLFFESELEHEFLVCFVFEREASDVFIFNDFALHFLSKFVLFWLIGLVAVLVLLRNVNNLENIRVFMDFSVVDRVVFVHHIGMEHQRRCSLYVIFIFDHVHFVFFYYQLNSFHWLAVFLYFAFFYGFPHYVYVLSFQFSRL